MPRLPQPRPDEPYRRFMMRCQDDDTMNEEYDGDDITIRRECQILWDDSKEANVDLEPKNEAIVPHYATKSAYEIKDLDAAKREVAVYLSKFDNIDSDGDVIKKGAFKKSIKERGPGSLGNRKIQFLRHHDWTKQIGTFNRLEEDENGLFAVGRLGTSSLGEDAWRDYNEGIIREHSIGFQLVKDKVKQIKDDTVQGGKYNLISEVVLFEGSAVTFGSNDLTNVVGVMKSQDKHSYLEKISNELYTIITALSIGKGSDERLYSLEMRAKYLSSQLSTLSKFEPSLQDTQDEVEPGEKAFNWLEVLNKINY